MIRPLSKRLALTAALTAASVATSDTASACCLTDWLFGRNTYAAGYAPVAGFAPVGAPTYSAGFAPVAGLPVQTGFQSAYTAGFAPNPGFVGLAPTANPIATTLALRTPQTVNAFRPFAPTTANLPVSAFAPQTYSLARPAFVDNPSVYTGQPVSNGFTSNLRGVSSASSIGASNIYPTNGFANVTYSSGFAGPNNVIGGPLQGGVSNGAPVTALPTTQFQPAGQFQTAGQFPTAQRVAPIRNGLSRFFGSLFGRGYQPAQYAAPVTYYRPVVSLSPSTGQTAVVQAGCTGFENLSTLAPVQQFAPSLGQTESSITAAPFPSTTFPSTTFPSATFPSATFPPSDGGTSFGPVAQSGFEAPLTRNFDGDIAPQTFAEPQPTFPSQSQGSSSRNGAPGDLSPVEQPRLESRRQSFETDASPYDAFRSPSNELEDRDLDLDLDADRSEDEDDYENYWGLQDAADSTAMIRPRRSSLIATGRSVEPIRGIAPQDQTDVRPRADRAVEQPAWQSNGSRDDRRVAPPLPARSSSIRRDESQVRAYEISAKSSLPFARPAERTIQKQTTLKRTTQPADPPIVRDAGWKPVR